MKRLPIVIAVVLVIGGIRYFTERPVPQPTANDTARDSSPSGKPSLAPAKPSASHGDKEKELPGGLKYEDLEVGKGDEAKTGDKVSVHYTGWLVNNKKFDSSLDRGQPFDVTLGQGGVIKGWDQGIPGMKVGGKRKLIIPPNLAYGETGQPPTIPGNATLIFQVELLGIAK